VNLLFAVSWAAPSKRAAIYATKNQIDSTYHLRAMRSKQSGTPHHQLPGSPYRSLTGQTDQCWTSGSVRLPELRPSDAHSRGSGQSGSLCQYGDWPISGSTAL